MPSLFTNIWPHTWWFQVELRTFSWWSTVKTWAFLVHLTLCWKQSYPLSRVNTNVSLAASSAWILQRRFQSSGKQWKCSLMKTQLRRFRLLANLLVPYCRNLWHLSSCKRSLVDQLQIWTITSGHHQILVTTLERTKLGLKMKTLGCLQWYLLQMPFLPPKCWQKRAKFQKSMNLPMSS